MPHNAQGRPAPSKPFPTEAALCAAFIASLPKEWTAYAETAGFDILLVRNSDGVQVGVEAKLKLNAEVVSQALEEGGYWNAGSEGPDYRAVLVPYGAAGFMHKIAAYIGFTILMMEPAREVGSRWERKPRFDPSLPGTSEWSDERSWFEWLPVKRCRLPEYVPDVAAGASAPLQLTQWKIAALRIEATIELRGFVTRADFAAHKIDHRRWMAKAGGWLVNDAGKLKPGPRFPSFKTQHPRVFAEIVADAATWMPKEPAL